MRILPFVLLIANLLSAQVKSDLFSKTINPDSAKNDLLLLRTLLDKFHPGEFQHTTKKEFDFEYESLYGQINHELSPLDQYKIIQRPCVLIKDGHTYADNSLIVDCLKNRLVIPFSITKIENRFHIKKVAFDSLTELIGKELISINSVPISEIIKKAELFMEREGLNESGFQQKYRIFPYYYFLTDTACNYVVEYSDTLKHVSSKKILGVSYSEFLKKTRIVVEPITFNVDKDGIGVLHVNTFAIPDFEFQKINYEKYFDQVFERCRKEKIGRLIIDVRGNGGGNAEVSNYLFSYLKKEEAYFYFKEICKKYAIAGQLSRYCTTPNNIQNTDTSKLIKDRILYCETNTGRNSFWWLKEQKPKKKPFQGTVVVLEDGGCFSTTGHFLALVRNYKAGYIIGDYSQGSYYSNDGGQYFELPYSKFKMRIPIAQFQMDVSNFIYDPKGIEPDKIIFPNLTDLLIGRDAQMLEAKNYILSH